MSTANSVISDESTSARLNFLIDKYNQYSKVPHVYKLGTVRIKVLIKNGVQCSGFLDDNADKQERRITVIYLECIQEVNQELEQEARETINAEWEKIRLIHLGNASQGSPFAGVPADILRVLTHVYATQHSHNS
jgi:hypothetical protein